MGATSDTSPVTQKSWWDRRGAYEGQEKIDVSTLPALERLQTLYPGAYARGSTSTHEGADSEMENLDVKVSARTHPGAAGFNSSLRGGDPSPTRPSSLVGATSDTSPVTRKSWTDGGSAYGGQKNIDLSTLAGVEDVWDRVKGGDGVGVTENPPGWGAVL